MAANHEKEMGSRGGTRNDPGDNEVGEHTMSDLKIPETTRVDPVDATARAEVASEQKDAADSLAARDVFLKAIEEWRRHESTERVTETAAADPLSVLQAAVTAVRSLGVPEDLVNSTLLASIWATGDIAADADDDKVKAHLAEWFADRDRRTHAAPLDHRYDRAAAKWKRAEHPEDYCNGRDCSVAPHVSPDGRAITNVGDHKTYVRTVLSENGDVMRVAIGRSEDVNGLGDGMVYLSFADQDLEHGDEGGSFDTVLTADEADELAVALTSRAKELRRLEQEESEAVAEETIRRMFPSVADGPAADADPEAV